MPTVLFGGSSMFFSLSYKGLAGKTVISRFHYITVPRDLFRYGIGNNSAHLSGCTPLGELVGVSIANLDVIVEVNAYTQLIRRLGG